MLAFDVQRPVPRVVMRLVTAAWLASLPSASFCVSARDREAEDSKMAEKVEREMS